MPVVISYARFSSAGQAEGSSLARQIEASEKYAVDNGLTISQAHRYSDHGISAFDQSNLSEGALGKIIEQIDSGHIPKGSTLIVESFDRLSRAEPIDAFTVFQTIISKGVTLVTLTNPPQSFSRASVGQNPMQLMLALMEMVRANAESKRKSDLVGAAWSRKRKGAEEGIMMSAKAPHWIDVTVNHDAKKDSADRRSAVVNEERKSVVLQIIEWAETGIGNGTIIKRLNETVPPWAQRIKRKGKEKSEKPPKWEPSYVQKLLTNPALYGAIDIDGELIEDYYPSVIEKARFDSLQGLRSARATTKNVNRKGKTVTNMFSGLLKCGYCGFPMNIAGYKTLKGRQAGYERKYVACHGARVGADGACKRMRMWFLDELEPALLFWLDKVDFKPIVGGERNDLNKLRERLASSESDLVRLRGRIDKGYEAILDGVEGLREKVKVMEIELREAQRSVERERQTLSAAESATSLGPNRMKALIKLFKSLKTTPDELALRQLREQISNAVHLVTVRIDLFPMGHNGSETKENRFVDVYFRNGIERRIEPSEC